MENNTEHLYRMMLISSTTAEKYIPVSGLVVGEIESHLCDMGLRCSAKSSRVAIFFVEVLLIIMSLPFYYVLFQDAKIAFFVGGGGVLKRKM